jgi:hypothetical protein
MNKMITILIPGVTYWLAALSDLKDETDRLGVDQTIVRHGRIKY